MNGDDVLVKRRRLCTEKLQKPMDIKTGCNPKDFKATCEGLSVSKRTTVDEMGFFALRKIGCNKLNREICQMLVDNIEVRPTSCYIKIHGMTVPIAELDITRVMGVKNGGTPVELDGCLEVSDMKEITWKIFGKEKDISMKRLLEIVVEREEADNIFKISFVLYALSTMLCPTSPGRVDKKFLIALRHPASISTKNWASLCYRHLLDGVLSYQKNRSGHMNGCMVFLPLFYFDSLKCSTTIVCKTLHPVVAWTPIKCKSMIEWIIGQGGFHSCSVEVCRTCDIPETLILSTAVDQTRSEDDSYARSRTDAVNKQIERLSSLLDNMEEKLESTGSLMIDVPELGGVRSVVVDAIKIEFLTEEKDTDWLENRTCDPSDDLTNIGMDIGTPEHRHLSPIYEATTPSTSGDQRSPAASDEGPVAQRGLDFPIKGEMTLPDWTLLNFVFREPCKGVDDSSYVVASFCDIILTKSDIDCLRPGKKICPKVMNIWAAYLSDKHSDSWFLPASFGV